jgi:glycosyltransferase involved in cell wall biosynthesis
MTVTVIVPVYNGAATLERCLAPLLAMQGAGEIAEIMVVDDGSTDASAAMAAALGARVVDSGGRLGPGGARNVAARLARGDVLWFVDADVVVHGDAARILTDALRPAEVCAVFGAYDDAPSAPNFLSQYKNLVHHFHHCEAGGEAETFWAGCGAIRKAAFLEAGGFDAERYPEPSIEDIELGLRLRRRGLRILLLPGLQGKHLKVWRLANLLHTEIFRRALPWSRLVLSGAGGGNALNIRTAERWRALLALAFLGGLPLALAAAAPWWLAVVLLAGVLVANRKLLALFRRRRGLLFALGGVLFHQIYYFYASVAFAWSWVALRAVRVGGASCSSKAR